MSITDWWAESPRRGKRRRRSGRSSLSFSLLPAPLNSPFSRRAHRWLGKLAPAGTVVAPREEEEEEEEWPEIRSLGEGEGVTTACYEIRGAIGSALPLSPPLLSCEEDRRLEEKEEEEQIVAALLYVQKEEKRSRPTSYSFLCIVELHRGGDAEGFLSRFIFEAGGKNPAAGSGIEKNFQFLLLLSPSHILD